MAKKKQPEIDFEKYFPGHPPEDYTGSIADWMVELQSRGLWDGQDPEWFGDVAIESEEYGDILEKLES